MSRFAGYKYNLILGVNLELRKGRLGRKKPNCMIVIKERNSF
jgi:hypothetical protein